MPICRTPITNKYGVGFLAIPICFVQITNLGISGNVEDRGFCAFICFTFCNMGCVALSRWPLGCHTTPSVILPVVSLTSPLAPSRPWWVPSLVHPVIFQPLRLPTHLGPEPVGEKPITAVQTPNRSRERTPGPAHPDCPWWNSPPRAHARSSSSSSSSGSSSSGHGSYFDRSRR